MAIQIVLVWSPECEEEMKKMGFAKREVYIKSAPNGEGIKGYMTEAQVKAGDREIFGMKNPPFQFVSTSWWGSGFG